MTDREPTHDLVAYLLGELPEAERAEIDRVLATSEALQGELLAVSQVLAASRDVPAPDPHPETLGAILATVGEEQRIGEELTALALGQLEGDEKAAARARVAADDGLAVEFRAIEDLITGARAEPGVVPSPQVLARLKERIAVESPEDGEEIPVPRIPAPIRRRGRVARRFAWIVPLAAAAGIVAAFLVNDHDPADGTQVTAGIVLHKPSKGPAGSENWIRAGNGGVDFRVGDELLAADGAVSLRVRCFPPSTDAAEDRDGPPDGTFDLRLQAGTRFVRADESRFELARGSIGIHAGSFWQRGLTISHGVRAVDVRGTRFDVTAVDDRLVVAVHDGSVVLRADTSQPDGLSLELSAGSAGLASDAGLLERALDGGDPVAAFLAPRLSLEPAEAAFDRGAPLRFRALLEAGEGGPVEITPFDDSRPLYVVRLKGPRDATEEVKLLSTMLTEAPPALDPRKRGAARLSFRLDGGKPYRLAFSIPARDLEPGPWQAVLRYTAYVGAQGARTGSRKPTSEWLGVVESEPVRFEVLE